jgi:hypothetical protein
MAVVVPPVTVAVKVVEPPEHTAVGRAERFTTGNGFTCIFIICE